jgi:molybdopterin molybdotransferase
MISYNQAYQLTLDHIQPLGAEAVELIAAVGRSPAEDLYARVDSPSIDASLKDGYAIQSMDIARAMADKPVRLKLVGMVAAGGNWDGEIQGGEALRILSGAPVPRGADAVVAEEFTQCDGELVEVTNDASLGRNILQRGADVRRGQLLVFKGDRLYPPKVGLLAAAGFNQLSVTKQPQIAILATGDEVIAPGESLVDGKLYASNLVTLAAWCVQFGFGVKTFVVVDNQPEIMEKLEFCLNNYDALLTSGGAWKGERDQVVHILDQLGWEKIYHRVRIGPGKAIGFGLSKGKPVFCLPGGPPSNHMAFLQLALPGLQKLAGYKQFGLPQRTAQLSETVRGQIDWTQFVHGRLTAGEYEIIFHPLKPISRLQMMAQADGIIMIPEGQEEIPAGRAVQVQLLKHYQEYSSEKSL